MTTFSIKANGSYSFNSTLFSHGWIDLAPFQTLKDEKLLIVSVKQDEKIYNIRLSSQTDRDILITCESEIDNIDKNLLSKIIRHMMRLDEDYAEFYQIASEIKEYRWIIEKCAGRMFRCATLWEDMIKMLCTTNCTWNLTKIMVNNLVEEIGGGVFPEPEQIAGKSEKFLREKIKMGYRAPYLVELSRSIADGKINLDIYSNWSENTGDLYKDLRQLKGFGDYAVSNLLKLLGHYDYYGSDSWSKKKFSEKHMAGEICTEKDIAKHYDHLGKWRGLFFWLDMTKDWYEREFPW
jgi:3-methyladenine DNA glycosylase/8-oxoguanine DNA glycosylase